MPLSRPFLLLALTVTAPAVAPAQPGSVPPGPKPAATAAPAVEGYPTYKAVASSTPVSDTRPVFPRTGDKTPFPPIAGAVPFPSTPAPAPAPTPHTAASLSALMIPREIDTGSSSALSIVYSGYRRTEVDPCGCHSNQLGGIDKEARLGEVIAERGLPVLKIDAGGFMKDYYTEVEAKRAPTLVKSLGAMGFSTVNIAFTDVSFGLKSLVTTFGQANLHAVSANLTDVDGKLLYEPYRIETVKLRSGEEVRVGLLGVTRPRIPYGKPGKPVGASSSPGAGARATSAPAAAVAVPAPAGAQPTATPTLAGNAGGVGAGVTAPPDTTAYVIDPVGSLRKYVPELRGKCDILILLAYARRDAVKSLLTETGEGIDKQIDLVVAGEHDGRNDVAIENGLRYVSGGYQGRQVGHLMWEVSGGKIVRQAHAFINIDQGIPSVPAITKIVKEYKDTLNLAPVGKATPRPVASSGAGATSATAAGPAK